jgi:hypothetical protein
LLSPLSYVVGLIAIGDPGVGAGRPIVIRAWRETARRCPLQGEPGDETGCFWDRVLYQVAVNLASDYCLYSWYFNFLKNDCDSENVEQ